MKAILFSVWLVSVMLVMNLCFFMMTEADTVLNGIGFILAVVLVVVSIKTKCFMSIRLKFSKKNENDS